MPDTSGPIRWDDDWTFGPGNNKVAAQLRYHAPLIRTGSRRMLDIGGSLFRDAYRDGPVTYHMIDLDRPMEIGSGGYNAQPDGFTFDGETLPFGEDDYDIVNIGFVLHHAAQHTIGLLKQVRRIARRHVLVLEDLASPEYPRDWLARNCRHQPGGVFRDDVEWRALFDLLGFDLQRAISIRLAGEAYDRPVRALYHLIPRPGG